MRLIVILSPTNRWGTKTAYTKLRDFLKSDGYIRIAPEVFMRITNNRKATEKHVQRLKPLDPGTGTVQIFRLTEKQYDNRFVLTAETDFQEDKVGKSCHISL